jgi:glycosyltransferase involved in cell wall biosynthesis
MRVSVLLACWNAASYVGEAVQSVLDQRPAPHEIIAVDDGSTDRSAAVLERFGTRLILIRQANSGVGAALNRWSRLRLPEKAEPAFTKNGMLLRGAAFSRLGGFDPERRNADFLAWYARAVGEGFRWRLHPDVVCRRRIHAQNMGRSDRIQQRRDYLLTMKAFLDARRRPRASAL